MAKDVYYKSSLDDESQRIMNNILHNSVDNYRLRDDKLTMGVLTVIMVTVGVMVLYPLVTEFDLITVGYTCAILPLYIYTLRTIIEAW